MTCATCGHPDTSHAGMMGCQHVLNPNRHPRREAVEICPCEQYTP